MSAPAGTPPGLSPWQNTTPHPPPMAQNNGESEDGVLVKPMRLKVLYTFDDQNKTNCLARWPHVLQIKTVAMDESTTIGVIELKTCINAIVQCSPELVARLGQDYTVYAYDYSEYDNPLVGQGMLSWALATSSPTPDAPASQSRQLITGRVCKNIMGLFTNGVKETLEVKLRLVPVPTVLQSEYVSTMEKYRELSKVMPPGFDPNEWTSFLQSNPNIGQQSNKPSPAPQPLSQPNNNQRDGVSMEVVNQLLSPSIQQQTGVDSFLQAKNPLNPGNEASTTTTGKGKANSRPASRAAVKRPRGRKPKAQQNNGGNTSGYEEGTDGDDNPASKKRAKVTKADWNSNMSLGTAPDSLRVAASTSGSLRMFRPIAMSPSATVGAGHLQEVPRAPTPVPRNPLTARDSGPPQSSLRRDSFSQLQGTGRPHISPYPPLGGTEDQVMTSIESAQPSPERHTSPGVTPPEIGSSPPLMRTRPGTPMRSSPPCASSPVLPQMPRTDSGFMSGTLDDLFGDDEMICPENDDEVDLIQTFEAARAPQDHRSPVNRPYQEFNIEEVMPGPMELLPTRMPIVDADVRAKAHEAITRAGSVMSEDGQVLPPLKKTNRPASRSASMSQSARATPPQQQPPPPPPLPPAEPPTALQNSERRPSEPQLSLPQPPEPQQVQDQPAVPPPAPNSRPGSRMMVRTASLGSLTFPQIPASDPVLPPSSLQRSQTWSEAPHPATEAPMPPADFPLQPSTEDGQSLRPPVPFSRTMEAKRNSIKSKLETALTKGEMPPFCQNCGAIETPTWRKAWSVHMTGKPGYYEYSDEPGRVTTINILTRDPAGEPTSYLLIKKFLLPQENQADFQEFLLCNPCGIWMSKYKTQRPESRWDLSRPQERGKGGERKRPQQRARSKKSQTNNSMALPTSEANFPQSEAYFPPSDANYPQSEAHHPQTDGMGPPELPQAPASGSQDPEGVSPGDTTSVSQQAQQLQGATVEDQRKRSGSGRPKKRLNAMTSNAASVALRRAIQSSPARWAGTQHSPIEVDEEELGSTRRLLFPSPRKDGSPKVLGELVTNVVTIATDFRSPKESMVEVQDKENCPPAIDAEDMDAELLRLFEEELAKEDHPRPTTPTQKSPVANPFKTPTRPTPSHRPITRSVSRSIRSGKSPRQLVTFNRTPSRTPRRSPRHHDNVFESPFTATLNQMMSEANNHTSPVRQGLDLDFSNLPNLPDLPPMGSNQHYDMNFSIEDLFSTDVPMPSSPPRMNFNLYEDPLTRGGSGSNINWDDFGKFGEPEVKVKEEPQESPTKLGGTNENNAGNEQSEST